MSVYLFIFSNRGSFRVIFFLAGELGIACVVPICELIGGRDDTDDVVFEF